MTIKEFGDFLYLLRVGKRLGINRVSRETGVDSNLLGRLERGNVSTFPRHKTLSSLSNFYDFRFQYVPAQLVVIHSPLPEKINEEFEEQNELETTISMVEGEKMLIERALIQTNFNRLAASKILKIGERTLYRKLEEYNIKT